MTKTKALGITIPAIFTALTAVLSQLSIPIQPIPFSLGIFGIFLTGALLSPKQAFGAILAYVAIGAVGLPVFASARGGISAVIGPTGGFIMAYPIMALVIALIIKASKEKYKIFTPIALAASLIICYAFGCGWYAIISDVTIKYAFSVAVAPFIAFDAVKIVIASIFAAAARRLIPQLTYKES